MCTAGRGVLQRLDLRRHATRRRCAGADVHKNRETDTDALAWLDRAASGVAQGQQAARAELAQAPAQVAQARPQAGPQPRSQAFSAVIAKAG